MKQPNTSTIEKYLTELVKSDTPLVLATVIQAISPTSGKPGDKALVSADKIVEGWIGGGCAQPAVIEAAGKALTVGEPGVIRIGPEGEWQALDGVVDFKSTCLSGGTLVIFIEPLIRPPTLCILGHSPVALSLCSQAEQLGFSVKIVSPDINSEQLPDSVFYSTDLADVNGDFMVIATQGKHDRAAITAALESSAGYISMVASESKMAGLKAILLETGLESKSLDRIEGPAGIDIGAETPAEIALSVLADLVHMRRSDKVKNDQPVSDQIDNQERPDKKPLDNEPAAGGCCGG